MTAVPPLSQRTYLHGAMGVLPEGAGHEINAAFGMSEAEWGLRRAHSME
jgi:hypothetical protein